ncbi:peptidyl-prolyl cis-trans isomerase B (cyclophilin B) [Rhodococcus sp. LBL1]|nr:peptidyl-prolyl cis-trans isomerase B (cyclophilin B) [Rhodococcus sp. LBL1]MDH6684126.1 peptidyl-prolyl cis-trans isomerase B (cyclophilin B) [Rhodococcus sp. LBL2]
MKRTALVAAGLGAALLLAGCSNDSGGSSESTTSSGTWTTPAAPTVDMSKYGALPAVPAPAAPTVDCSYPAAGQAAKPVQAPNGTGVSTEGTVPVAMTTNDGAIGLTLDRTKAPCTVNSFVGLAQQGYFDNTPCHRISTSPGLEMLQCGDPSGRGTGGPGYQYANEYPTNAYAPSDPALRKPVVYPRGTVAMANAGADTNGGQFFLVFADSVLPPMYTVFGTISEEGLTTLEKIASAGVEGSTAPGDGAPTNPVTIQAAKVA